MPPFAQPSTPSRGAPSRAGRLDAHLANQPSSSSFRNEPRNAARADDPLGLAWRRSASCGLTPQSAWPGAPDPDGLRSHRLAEAARPVMDSLDEMLKDTGAFLLLGDSEGRVIRTARDNARVSRMLLKRGVDDGASLSEDSVGNNGIGTALETRKGVSIHGEQHFAEALKDFVCYGHPIVDPLTRRLVGAVDLTGMDSDASRMFAPFVRKIVADIEARYVDTARADDRELWHRFVERTRNSDTATCAFGDEVVLASHSSLERLASRDMVTLRRLVERDELGDTIALSSGAVRVTASRVGSRGYLLDLTFPDDLGSSVPALSATSTTRSGRAAAVQSGPASAARNGQLSAVQGGRAPAVGRQQETRTGAQVSDSPATAVVTRAQAVVGPAGSGRSTTARSIAGPDATHVRLAEADDPTAAWRDLVVPALRNAAGPLIFDDIDLLDEPNLRRLAARLTGTGLAGASLVVVTSRDEPLPAVTEVLDACGARTVLRPLHERGDEGAEIVKRMVADLAAERGITAPTVSARFADAVCTADLPNGLTSVRSILGECLGDGVAHLDVDALPSRARSARPPRTGELARGEYDAIVAALADCDGVRSRAAKRLGISRTTLYARMREFGLS